MRFPRMTLASIAAGALVVMGILLFTMGVSPLKRAPDGAALVRALSHHATDLRDRGQSATSIVTLETLVRSGHLKPAEASEWKGVRITFYRDANETRPQSIVAVAVMPDGSGTALLGDGSVQQLTRARLEMLHQQKDQPLGPTSGD